MKKTMYSLGVLTLAVYIVSSFMSYFLTNHVDDITWQLITVLFIFWIGRLSVFIEGLIEAE